MEQLSPEQREDYRKRSLIATAEDIRVILEQMGWTIVALDFNQENTLCGAVTASKGDVGQVTYYFEYHTLAFVEEQFKRISGET